MKNVVLVGGGHTHIQVLESFDQEPPPPCNLTLIVDRPIAVYSGMVPGYIAQQYRAEELEIDAEAWARRVGAEVVVDRAVRVDPGRREIEVESGEAVPYDIASFDIGSTIAALELPGVREHAIPTRPIAVFNERVGEVAERARARGSAQPFRVVVVGAGAAGVEVAFTSQHRLERETEAPVKVQILEAGPRILPGYSRSLVRLVERRAARRGIELRCDAQVLAAEADGVKLADDEHVPSDALFWVTGAVSHPLFRDSGLPTDDRGFVLVRSTLQFEMHDDLFACGDCATLIEHPDTPKAGVYAVRQGPIITANLRAALTGQPLTTYTPQGDFLMLMNLGDGTALGTKWGFAVGGRWVMRLKDSIDKRFVRRFQDPLVSET